VSDRNRDRNRDWTVAPGEIIREFMQENGLGPHALATGVRVLATACGCMRPGRLQKLIDGRVKMTRDDAHRLAAGTGIPASLWLRLEQRFRSDLAEGKVWNP
jgi:plasmid maintenance system antidote protein VapI